MNAIRYLWAAAVAFALVSGSAQGQTPAPKHYALVIARPVSMKFKSELESTDPDTVMHGQLYTGKFSDLRVVIGSYEPKGSLSLDIVASQPRSVTNEREVFLYLEIGSDDSVRLVYWGRLQSIVCIPESLRPAEKLGMEFRAFRTDNTVEEQRCAGI